MQTISIDSHPLRRKAVLVIDDHPVIRVGFKAALLELAEVRILEAGSLGEGIAHLQACPDLPMIITDLCLPDASGVATVLALRAAAPHARIAVTSCELTPEAMARCYRSGARWFFDKAASPGMVAPILDTLLKGESLVPAALVDAIEAEERAAPAQCLATPLEAARPAASPLTSPAQSLPAGLNGRLLEAAQLLSQGLSNKRIAARLGITPGTTKNYVARILEILAKPNRSQAALALALLLAAQGAPSSLAESSGN